MPPYPNWIDRPRGAPEGVDSWTAARSSISEGVGGTTAFGEQIRRHVGKNRVKTANVCADPRRLKVFVGLWPDETGDGHRNSLWTGPGTLWSGRKLGSTSSRSKFCRFGGKPFGPKAAPVFCMSPGRRGNRPPSASGATEFGDGCGDVSPGLSHLICSTSALERCPSFSCPTVKWRARSRRSSILGTMTLRIAMNAAFLRYELPQSSADSAACADRRVCQLS